MVLQDETEVTASTVPNHCPLMTKLRQIDVYALHRDESDPSDADARVRASPSSDMIDVVRSSPWEASHLRPLASPSILLPHPLEQARRRE